MANINENEIRSAQGQGRSPVLPQALSASITMADKLHALGLYRALADDNISSTLADLAELLLMLGIDETAPTAQLQIATMALKDAVGAIRRYLRYDPALKERTEYYPRMDFSQQGREGIWEVSNTQAYIRQLAEAVTNELQVTHIPIRSITELFVDYDGRSGNRAGAFASESELTEGEDFWTNDDIVDSTSAGVCKDGIIRSVGRWPSVPGSVKIVYTAGYTEEELLGVDPVIDASPIRAAILDEAVRRFYRIIGRQKHVLAGFVGPLSGETLGEYSYTRDTSLGTALMGGSDIAPENYHKLQEFIRFDLGVM